MRRLAAMLCLSGCALQTWAVPQPSFVTKEADTVFPRMVEAAKAHCGGTKTVNEEAGIVVGPWQAWNTGNGMVLTHCVLSLLRGDEKDREVRVSYAVRTCPLSSMDDLEALAATCELTDVVPELVNNSLTRISEKLQKDIAR